MSPEPRLLVDGEAVDPVHRAEQEVPGVAVDRVREPLLARADVVDLEPQLDGQTTPLRVEMTASQYRPGRGRSARTGTGASRLGGLPEVVDVLGEADLVDAARGRGLDVALDRLRL